MRSPTIPTDVPDRVTLGCGPELPIIAARPPQRLSENPKAQDTEGDEDGDPVEDLPLLLGQLEQHKCGRSLQTQCAQFRQEFRDQRLRFEESPGAIAGDSHEGLLPLAADAVAQDNLHHLER
jgi:hypothetical protein